MRKMPRPKGYHWDLKTMVQRPDGQRACRWCKGPVAKGRRNWCADPRCLEEWTFRTRPEVFRAVVFRRDQGVCAACGFDTKQVDMGRLRHQLYLVDAIAKTARYGEGWREWKDASRVELAPDGNPFPREHWLDLISHASLWLAANKLQGDRSPWEADHIVEVADGGDWFDLGNVATLCVPCHRRKTAESRRRRAEARKNALRCGTDSV